MSITEDDLYSMCESCGGSGSDTMLDHHPECEGRCLRCPIEIEIGMCPLCVGTGREKKPILEVIKEAKEKAKNESQE